jgi:hypothetical protein
MNATQLIQKTFLLGILAAFGLSNAFADDSTEQKIQALQEQIDILASSIESGGAASTGWWEKTSVGGYGELHYNNKEGSDDQIDFHRFVLFVNHDYTDKIALFTELELEHALAGEGKEGEVELEQAFIRFALGDGYTADAGLFLVPVGLLNETHEPDTFFGVERNNVEKYIIPTTWWQAGARLSKDFGNGLTVDFALTDGLKTTDGYIRGGRQKVANASANDGAYTLRAVYRGIPGLELGASLFQQDDLSQGASADIEGTLSVFHLVFKKHGFGLKALSGSWDIDTDTEANDQSGYYIEPSYTWDTDHGKVGVFYRVADYNYYSYNNDTSTGKNNDKEDTSFGINYYPTDYVVLKADLTEDKAGKDTLSLGVGYQF